MAFTLLERLLSRGTPSDGAAAALEEPATGIDNALLDAAAEGDIPATDLSAPAGAGRRDRKLRTGHELLADGMATKVLHGWLQNRHQTLYPLTVNFRSLRPEEGEALARWMAAAALVAGQVRGEEMRAWLRTVGAGAAVLGALDDALARPEAFTAAVDRVGHGGLAAYAYVGALVATDRHEPATTPFLEFLANRLLLPAEVVRSANRRYGR